LICRRIVVATPPDFAAVFERRRRQRRQPPLFIFITPAIYDMSAPCHYCLTRRAADLFAAADAAACAMPLYFRFRVCFRDFVHAMPLLERHVIQEKCSAAAVR